MWPFKKKHETLNVNIRMTLPSGSYNEWCREVVSMAQLEEIREKINRHIGATNTPVVIRIDNGPDMGETFSFYPDRFSSVAISLVKGWRYD